MRRHSHSKHPDKPIKWIDLQSGQVCVDSQRHADCNAVQLTNFPSPSAVTPRLKATARKSTAKGMKVAMFRSSLFNGRKNDVSVKPTSSETSNVGDELLVIEDSDDDNAVHTGNEDEDNDTYSYTEPEPVGQQATSILRFCCHLCSFNVLALSPSAFAQHLLDVHSTASSLPRVEIFPASGGEDDESLLALYRCGLCVFESYVQRDYDTHVLKTHGLNRPLVCDICHAFASFDRTAIKDHFSTVHRGLEPRMGTLNRPYTMIAVNIVNSSTSNKFYNLTASVMLEDIAKLSCSQLESLLLSNGVTTDELPM